MFAHDGVIETEFDGTADSVTTRQSKPNTFLDFTDQSAVVEEIPTILKQRLRQSVIDVKGSDDKFKRIRITVKGVRETHFSLQWLVFVAVVKYEELRTWEFD